MSTVYTNFHRGLLQVHGELREAAGQIGAGAAGDGPPQPLIAAFCQTLLDHHRSEDRFFFPAFRAAGRLRSSDVAFLAARDAEHLWIHRLCLALRALGEEAPGGAPWRQAVAARARELGAASAPHFAEEEATLTPAHLP